jgi:hypothetical protein
MKARQLSKSLASLIGLAILFLSTSAHALTEISGDDLQALITSGEEIVVPEGETYVLILPDGKEVKLIAGTTFTVVQEDGKTRIVRQKNENAPRPPYERMKEFPRKIVEENLNDISPS